MSVYRPKYRDPKSGELKEATIWWYEFVYDGQRVRESAKTARKTVAAVTEENRRKAMERARAGLPTVETPRDRIRTVRAALAAYRKTYPINHRAKSVEVVEQRSPHIDRLLGSLLMPDLTADKIREYMAARKAEKVSNRTINLELGVLSRAIGQKFGMLWPNLKPLEENHDVGRALSPDEERRVVEAAARNRSMLISTIVRIALTTGMRRDEIRTLRWQQIDFVAKTVRVGLSKTEAGRGRVIELGPRLLAILEGHAAWHASRFGLQQPDWYLFPFSNRSRPIDPTRPILSFKKAWDSVRKTADVQCRFHDLRHTVCTKMAEAGIPEATMLAIMGHMSRAMLERYSHIRKAAKIEAMTAIEARTFSFTVPKEIPKVSESQPAKATVTH